MLTGGGVLWYSIKAVAERRGGRTEKRLEKNEKKFLTNGFRFDIINKLFQKRRRSEKFDFWKICFKNFEKSFEKVNDSFVSYLEALGEVDISDDYKVEFSTETLEDSFKKAIITVRYDVNGEEKSITINKLKVKEK